MSGLLKVCTPSMFVSRNLGKCKFVWKGEGKQYPGFIYYPRYPDFEDPPFDPPKLFMVTRIKPMLGAPYWEKNILKECRLDGKLNEVAVIKNIPENNSRLWKIKHLIKITPITYPDGFPKETDRTVLKENGELRIIKDIKLIEKKLELTEQFQKDPKRMDGDTIRRQQRKNWLNAWDTSC